MTRTFFAPGLPAPKGSTRSFMSPQGRLVTVNDSARTKPWMGVIATAAAQAGVTLATGSVSVRMTFYMPRNKGHLRPDGSLKPSAPASFTKKPDVDKLVRCVLDALTCVAYTDDQQVGHIEAAKVYASADHPPGVRVTVALDAEMAKPASPERGRRVARLANDLDLANDAALHFGLGEALRPRKKAPRG